MLRLWPLAALGLVSGTWCLQQQAELPWLGGVMIVPLLAMGTLTLRARRRVWFALASLVCAGVFGFYWAAMFAHVRMSDALPSQSEGRDIRVVGEVRRMPDRTPWGWRFAFRVDHVLTPGAVVPAQIQLLWPDAARAEAASPSRSPVIPGEIWRFVVRLKRPHGNYNPNGFDYESVLLERAISATGYVRATDSAARLTPHGFDFNALVERWRHRLRERMQAALGADEYGGVLIALALGDQRAISTDQWQLFTRTGVNHLMSISGLHITMFAALLSAFTRACWRRSSRLTHTLPDRVAGAYSGFIVAMSYALLTGFAIPAQRTVLMLGVATVAAVCRARVSGSDVLSIALFAVLFVDPWAVSAPGFWLSFAAVAVLVCQSTHGVSYKLLQWAREQWALTLVLAPCLLLWFQQLSLVAPIANAIAVPAVSCVIVPLALLLCVFPLDCIAVVAHGAIALLGSTLEVLGNLPGATWSQHAPSIVHTTLATIGLSVVLLPCRWPWRVLALCLIGPMLLIKPHTPGMGEAWVEVLDVGQGLAVVIQTHAETLLFDAGPAWSGEADSGARIVVPYLRAQGLRKLDGVIASHDDTDHSGGIRAVLDHTPSAWLMSSWMPDAKVMPRNMPRVRCVAGQRWHMSGVEFEVLHPNWTVNDEPVKDNDRSCVLRVRTARASVLITGDIEQRSERVLIAGSSNLRADVLIVPHHGSATSSTPPFIAAVRPQHAVFTVGYRNRFGHPHPTVLERYAESDVKTWRTDRDGAVKVCMCAAGVAVSAWRDEAPRYWHTRD